MATYSDHMTKQQVLSIDLGIIFRSVLIWKNLVFSIILVSLCATTVFLSYAPKIYRAEAAFMIIKEKDSELISAKEFVDMLGKFTPEKMSSFAQFLNVESVQIKALPGSNDKFRILIESKSTRDFQTSLDQILAYVNSMPILTNKLAFQRERLEKRLQEISSLIEKSQKDSKYLLKLVSAGKLNPIGFNPIDINKTIYDLKMEQADLKQKLANLKGVELISPLNFSKNPVKPNKLLVLFATGIISLLFAVCLSVLLQITRDKKKRNTA